MAYQTTYSEAMSKLTEAQKCQGEIESGRILYSTNELIKDRNKKLNEALSKALDLADDEMSMHKSFFDSDCRKALKAIYSYVESHDIQCPYSAEVNTKLVKLIDKGISDFKQFLDQQRMHGQQ